MEISSLPILQATTNQFTSHSHSISKAVAVQQTVYQVNDLWCRRTAKTTGEEEWTSGALRRAVDDWRRRRGSNGRRRNGAAGNWEEDD
ncbi:hypothetical protein LguiA_003972 [Lonicera macranthoides]